MSSLGDPRIDARSSATGDGAELARLVADQAFSRTAGAPLVPGNRVRLLRDARDNYPAWQDAIAAARRTIHFESYIIHEDAVGREFAGLLAERARSGVRVRVLYDWYGALGHTRARFWRVLREAGVEVRCFGPPRIERPFAWLSRDHRKMIAVDGRVGFVSGLCVGGRWVGDPTRGLEPWRDTGVEIAGPAVADLEWAFAETWALAGPAIPERELPARERIPPASDVALRVVASRPTSAELYRLDQLIAAGARRTLWLTDAYFVGLTPYVQALRSAAADGVDVRLLVPNATDIRVLRAVSRASYRPLLEAGVRVFEWNGPMLHAKTAVADGRWSRVGSTNLNVASWLGNWELDVAVEDNGFARDMETMYVDDLAHATEIVLGGPRVQLRLPPGEPASTARGQGSVGRAAAGAIGIGRAVGAAITDRRALGPAEARVIAGAGLAVLLGSLIALLWPRLVTTPLGVLGLLLGLALLVRARRLRAMAGSVPRDEASTPGVSGEVRDPRASEERDP